MLNQPIKKCNHTETCIFQNSVVYSVIINVCREESLGSLGQPAPARAAAWTQQYTCSSWHFLTSGPRILRCLRALSSPRRRRELDCKPASPGLQLGIRPPIPLASALATHSAPPPCSQASAETLAHCAPSHPPLVLLRHVDSFSREWSRGPMLAQACDGRANKG